APRRSPAAPGARSRGRGCAAGVSCQQPELARGKAVEVRFVYLEQPLRAAPWPRPDGHRIIEHPAVVALGVLVLAQPWEACIVAAAQDVADVQAIQQPGPPEDRAELHVLHAQPVVVVGAVLGAVARVRRLQPLATLAGVDQQRAAVVREPAAVLDSLMPRV